MTQAEIHSAAARKLFRRTEPPQRTLGPADRSNLLADAAAAGDPLAFLKDFPDVQATLQRYMRVRWSSRRARALGHPASLRGQTWTSLSGVAQAEVREGLRHLAAYERNHVRRGPDPDSDIDTFLMGLAEVFARHTGYPFHEIGLSSYLEGAFVGLVKVILDRLPPLPSKRPRIHPKLGTVGALSRHWRRIRAHARTGSDE